VFAQVKQYFRTWLFRPKIEHGTVTLTQRRIFILPTRQGLFFGVVLVLMLLGDINYNLSLGYVLTFLLAMMAVISMLFTFRNLAHLQVRAGRAEAVFLCDIAYFQMHFYNPSTLARYQIGLRDSDEKSISFDAPEKLETQIAFPVHALRRGLLKTGRLTLFTKFPLGLFFAWSYLHFDTDCLVYPKPLNDAPLPQGNAPDGAGKLMIAGDEEFAGLRNYATGDALSHIAWKTYARGQSLQVKQFANPLGEELWLDFADTPDFDEEEKLSRLTRWVLDAETQGFRYGLQLPDGEIAVNHGSAHRDECLRRLALFNAKS